MITEINWWELDDNEIFIVKSDYCDLTLGRIQSRYKNLDKFRSKLNIGLGIYHSLKYKKQGINNKTLCKVLDAIYIDFSELNDKFDAVGRFKSASFIFPIKISPYWSCLLAHSFFDGYADKYIMRYSNYDKNNRHEFTTLINRIFEKKLIFNAPKNPRRDIDLPAIVPRLLNKFFNIPTFYSNKCRIPKVIFKFTKFNQEYGYQFLKGAYIDEGSISGGQIWIVRGIINKLLAQDLLKLCRILDIKVRIKLSNKKKGGYSVGVKKESFNSFYDNVNKLFWHPNKKWSKIERMIIRHRTPLQRDKFGRFMKRELYHDKKINLFFQNKYRHDR